MNTATFDTHQAVRRLEDAGVDHAHAEAIVSEMREASASSLDHLVTKSDLKADLAELKADLLKLAIGIVVANTALTVTLVKLL